MRSGRLVHYCVTPRCDRLLAEGDGRIFSLGAARPLSDGWTVVWHQIPEDRRLERSRLARRLRFLGFGSVQEGVWVSPHDHVLEVDQLLSDLQVESTATTFLAAVGASPGLPALVARAWDLSGLVERYESFVREFKPFLRRTLDDGDAFLVRTRLMHLFRGFPFVDPELPEELAPIGRPRGAAVEIFHAVYSRLADGSQRHFDAAMVGPVAALT